MDPSRQCYAVDNFSNFDNIMMDICTAINSHACAADKAEEGSTNMQLVAHANARKQCILPAFCCTATHSAYRGVGGKMDGRGVPNSQPSAVPQNTSISKGLILAVEDWMELCSAVQALMLLDALVHWH